MRSKLLSWTDFVSKVFSFRHPQLAAVANASGLNSWRYLKHVRS